MRKNRSPLAATHLFLILLFFTALTATTGGLLVSCTAAASPVIEYKLIFEVDGVASADVTYSDLETDPVTDIFTEAGAAVPYTREETGAIDHSDLADRQFSVTADVAAGETLTVTVYYEELLAFPPEGNRRIAAEDSFTNNTVGAIPGVNRIVNFALPKEAP